MAAMQLVSKSAGAYHLQSITPCAKKGLATRDYHATWRKKIWNHLIGQKSAYHSLGTAYPYKRLVYKSSPYNDPAYSA